MAKGISVTIRNLPIKTRNELAARAARNGQSLQEYLHAHLTELTSRLDVNTWLARVQEEKERSESRVTTKKILRYRDSDRR